MPIAHQWDYLFAIGTMFAFLDAYNIGANDVANSFATSVSSKSLSLKQACIAAALCEFLGAVLVGARVASTIKNGIISLTSFDGNAGVQLLAFTVALVVSASWLMVCTRLSWPVSTTYSIVSALAGVGVAVGGKDAVQWGWNGGKGLATIFAGFIIAPSIAAGFGAIIFLLAKYTVLERKNQMKAAFIMGPFFFFVAACVCTMSIVYKGAPNLKLDKLSGEVVAGAIVGTGGVVAILAALFWVPFVNQKVVKKDYTLRFYHFFLGPALFWREAPADAGQIGTPEHVMDYRVYKEEENTPEAREAAAARRSDSLNDVKEHHNPDDIESTPAVSRANVPLAEVEGESKPDVGPWYTPKNLVLKVWSIISHGTSIDIHAEQRKTSNNKEADRLREMHLKAKQYPSEVEHAFSFLQVLTACTASFAHGSNDVANAIGPYAAIYWVWSTSLPLSKSTPTPVWILVFGGAAIVIGLSTYGYNIMRILGNKLTLMSPSRGFSMELGAAITVLLASQYGLPVSTTMCITGATLGVALANFDLKAFNWRTFGWIVLGWVITVPVVGVLSGCLMGIILNAPHF